MNKLDKIESFFKARLRDSKPAENGWNNAPPEILSNIMSQLDEQQAKKKKRRLFLLLLSGLIIGLTSFGLYTNNRINQLSNQVTQIEEGLPYHSLFVDSEAENLEEQTNLNDRNKETIESKLEAESAVTIQSKLTQTQSTEQINHTKINIKEPGNNGFIIQGIDKTRSPLSNASTQNTLPTIADELIDNINFKKDEPASQLLTDRMSLLALEPKQIKLPVFPQMSTYDIKNDIQLQSKWYMQAGSLFSSMQMTPIENMDFALSQYSDFTTGSYVELGYIKPFLERFSASISTRYLHYQSHSLYEKDMLFDNQKVTTNTLGQKEYNTALSVISPITNFNEIKAFNIDGKNMDQDDIMAHTAEIDQSFSSFGFKLGVQYKILNYSNWSFSAGLTMSSHYIVQAKEHIRSQLYHQDDMMVESIIDKANFNEVNRLYFSPGIESFLQYKLNQRLQLGIAGSYERSLHSIRNLDTSAEPKTYLQSFQTGLLIQYSF